MQVKSEFCFFQRVIFNIVNFSKTKSLYREGMSPMVKSSSRRKWWVFVCFVFRLKEYLLPTIWGITDGSKSSHELVFGAKLCSDARGYEDDVIILIIRLEKMLDGENGNLLILLIIMILYICTTVTQKDSICF